MASTPSPTAAYRAQNGIPQTGSYDPTVVGYIVKAAKATGADPAALLATSLQEDGARLHATGDQGTSFGPFQFHVGGALGNHPASWASTYDAVLNRAGEFAKYGVKGGKGAAAVQRPRDQALYAKGVDGMLARAHAILAHYTGQAPSTKTLRTPTPAASAPASSSAEDPGGDHILAALGQLHSDAHLPGLNPANSGSLIQTALDQLGGYAGIKMPELPVESAATAAPPEAPAAPAASRVPTLSMPVKVGKVISGAPKIIGTPFQGTHAKAFNISGGSNNWESENAVDIALKVGTPIRAPYSGTIGSQIGSLGSGGRFAGLRVHLAGAGQELYFAHLSKLAVKAGQHVTAGQVIGYSGSANGVAHLHLAAKAGNPGRYA